jgi:hypothetical protein
MQADECYMNYVHFLAALKNRDGHEGNENENFLTSTTSLSYSEAERSEKSDK